MTGFDFTWFENMYAVVARFADTVFQFFFVDTLSSVLWNFLNSHLTYLAAQSQYDAIMKIIPGNIEYIPIGFGLLFGAFGFFAVYTIVKWVLDIVF